MGLYDKLKSSQLSREELSSLEDTISNWPKFFLKGYKESGQDLLVRLIYAELVTKNREYILNRLLTRYWKLNKMSDLSDLERFMNNGKPE